MYVGSPLKVLHKCQFSQVSNFCSGLEISLVISGDIDFICMCAASVTVTMNFIVTVTVSVNATMMSLQRHRNCSQCMLLAKLHDLSLFYGTCHKLLAQFRNIL